MRAVSGSKSFLTTTVVDVIYPLEEIESSVGTQTFSDDDNDSGRCTYIHRGEIESCVRTQNFSDDDDSGRCTDIHQGKVRTVSGPKNLLMTTTVSDVQATIRGK